MVRKRRQFETVAVFVSILLLGVVALNGCKKKSEPAPEETVKEVAAAAVVGEQTVCPIMGLAINKELFTEYKGKKVYFCCPACKPQFEKDPEKYLAKLPQFKK